MRKLAIAVLAVALLPLGAEAQRGRKPKAAPTPVPTEVSLPIPQSEFDLDTYVPEMKPQSPVSVEFSASTWAPREFTRSTYSGSEDEFDSGDVPFLAINRIAPLTEKTQYVYSKLGVSAATLNRGPQDLSLFGLRVGAELRSPCYFSDVVEGYAGLSALPTLALGSRSQLENKVNEFGVPFEATLGALFSPSFLPGPSVGAKRTSIGLGVHYLFGSVGGSKVDGLGAQGSLRVDL